MNAKTLALLWSAICTVESENHPTAHNVAEDARGIAQIRKVLVMDVNRILAQRYPWFPEFTHDDAWCPTKSAMMYYVYMTHYGNAYYQYYNSEPSLGTLAAIWNGGPRGYKKTATIDYVAKIEEALDATTTP